MRKVVRYSRGWIAVGGILALTSGVAFAQSINTNYVPGTDFSKYKTYKWVPVEGQTAVDQITEGEIKQAVDKQLAAKSMTKTDSDDADVYVGYQAAVQQEKELNAYGTPGWRFGGGMADISTSTVDKGTLVVDVYDPKDKKLLWRGAATETIGKSSSPEKKQEHLDKAMTKLFKKYPPQK
jgi:hypothetical protein